MFDTYVTHHHHSNAVNESIIESIDAMLSLIKSMQENYMLNNQAVLAAFEKLKSEVGDAIAEYRRLTQALVVELANEQPEQDVLDDLTSKLTSLSDSLETTFVASVQAATPEPTPAPTPVATDAPPPVATQAPVPADVSDETITDTSDKDSTADVTDTAVDHSKPVVQAGGADPVADNPGSTVNADNTPGPNSDSAAPTGGGYVNQ